jgi:hypothetical protein
VNSAGFVAFAGCGGSTGDSAPPNVMRTAWPTGVDQHHHRPACAERG